MLAVVMMLMLLAVGAMAAPAKPHVLFLLIDDLGWNGLLLLRDGSRISEMTSHHFSA